MKQLNKKIVNGVVVVVVGGLSFVGLIWLLSGGKPSESSSSVNTNVKGKIYFKDAVGTKAPDFELESIDGKMVKLSDYLGKNVVFFFNEGAVCYPACWNQIAELGNDSRFDSENLVAFSVVTDTRNKWLDIVAKSPNLVKSKILFDTSRSVSKAYDVMYLNSSMHAGALPGHTYFVIDKEGTIRFTLDDPNMAIANDRLIKEIENLK